jgi:hypothetical protein
VPENIPVLESRGSSEILRQNLKRAVCSLLSHIGEWPTGFEPAGDTLWIAEYGVGQAMSIPIPK